jgi:hypothetical protein
VSFFVQNSIIGFTDPALGLVIPHSDDVFSQFVIGVTKLASDANAQPLYRLRLDDQNDALGGSGGIPGGRAQQNNFPGYFGKLGRGGSITGLPH